MSKMFKKKLFVGVLAVAVMSIPAVSAFAADTYTSYALPTFQNSNHTGSHEKQTADQFMNNKVTNLTHTDTAVFWATDGVKTVISNDYEQKVNNTSKIQFRNDIKKGSDVILGMRNKDYNFYQNAFVSGEVDFR